MQRLEPVAGCGSTLDALHQTVVWAWSHAKSRMLAVWGIADIGHHQPGWRGQDTYIQKEGIADDFGVFDSPDAFYARHGSNLSGLKRWLYRRVIRHAMNRNVARIRESKW